MASLPVASAPLSHRKTGVDEYIFDLIASKFSSLSGVEGSDARGVHDAESDDGVKVFEILRCLEVYCSIN
jgi:hypothetical protein